MTAWFHESTDPGERRQDQTDGKPLFRLDFNRSNLNLLLDEGEVCGLVAWLNHVGSDCAREAADEIDRERGRTFIQMRIEDAEAAVTRLRSELAELTRQENP